MVNDTIADMLTRVRNANLARHKIVQIPSTKMTRSISSVLLEEGFIQDFEEIGDGINKQLLLSLKYKGKEGEPVITSLKRISRPGLRVYANRKELPRVLGGLGVVQDSEDFTDQNLNNYTLKVEKYDSKQIIARAYDKNSGMIKAQTAPSYFSTAEQLLDEIKNILNQI